jgi:sialidase-1
MNIIHQQRVSIAIAALLSLSLNASAHNVESSNTPATTQSEQASVATKNLEQTLFKNKEAQYRIPAIVECKSGKIIAFTDHRYDNRDIGGGRHLDIVAKESTNKGISWTETERIIARGGNHITNSFDCAHGDAAPVVDWKTGEILLMCASGGIGYWESTRENPQMMGRYYSNDEGKTWQAQEVTSDVYGLMPEVTSAFFTSGRICQSRRIKAGTHYRLYTALTTRQGNRVLYSDDFGKTWGVLGSNAYATAPKGDEAKIVELPDGNVLISSRTQYGRFFNIFTYADTKTAEGTWGEVAMSSAQNNGVRNGDSACNGEILCVKAKDTNGKKVHLLLQSVPIGPGRSNVAIFYKALRTHADYASPEAIASNWEGSYQVSHTTSAYSTMVQTKKGNIIFLYEENAFRHPETEPDDYYDIVFKQFTINEITAGKYNQ